MSDHTLSTIHKILCIDDDDEYNFLTQEAFNDLEFQGEIVFKTYADDALDYLAGLTEFPGVIILDINLPTMNGWEFLAEFEARGYHERHPTLIFMHSSSVYEEDRQRSRTYKRVRDYIDKPIDENGIKKICDWVMQERDM